MNLWRAFTERQFQRAERQFHAQTKAEAPAAHDSGKDIHDHRQVDELFAQANVCDVDIVLVWLPNNARNSMRWISFGSRGPFRNSLYVDEISRRIWSLLNLRIDVTLDFAVVTLLQAVRMQVRLTQITQKVSKWKLWLWIRASGIPISSAARGGDRQAETEIGRAV